MKPILRRFFAALALLSFLPAGALALTGQSYTTFMTYYEENISYLNDCEGRYLLPKDMYELDLEDNGRTQYYTYSDALQVTIAVDAEDIIETCEIRLLIPEGTEYNNSLYLDYVKANYHCIAFIMSMRVSAEPETRLLLAEDIRSALEENYGAYERQLGSYTISCVSVSGEGAVFYFTNNGLESEETETETDTDEVPPEIIDDDEAANYG